MRVTGTIAGAPVARTVAAAAKKKIAEPVLFFFSGAAADLRCEGAAALTVV
jgi:hypothetical protein